MKTFAALLLLVPGLAFGQQCGAPPASPVPRDAVALVWVAPSTNTDGSAITKPITYAVYDNGVSKCTTSSVTAGLIALSVGAHPFTVTAKTSDGESVPSNVATKTVLAAPPNPPTSLTVNGALTAYRQRDAVDGFAMVPIGTVPAGTACNAALTVNGLYVVPRAAVKLATPFDTLPLKVFAFCS